MNRLFVGIPIPHDFSAELLAFQEENKFVQGINWVPEKNLHITLCFIGDYATEKIPELKNILSGISSKYISFQTEFEHFKFGPTFNKAYMLWATFKKNNQFTQLATDIEEAILKTNIKKEPLPHITLCRFKRIEKKDITLDFPVELNKINIKQFNLYESILKKSGAEYQIVHKFNLLNA